MTCPAPERSSPPSLAHLLLRAAVVSLVVAATQVRAEQATSTEPAPALVEPAAAASATIVKKKAAVANSSVEWQALNPDQRHLLAALEGEWNTLSPSRKGKWLELAARYPTMSADEQQRMQERISSWAQLSPTERQQARLAFQAARDLKADERQAKWEAYQALPSERRQALSDKATQKQQPPSQASAAPVIPGPTPKSMLVPLAATNLPDRPLGPVLLQAKPGASTVLINAGSSRPKMPGSGSGRSAQPGFDAELLDRHTLLPKPRTAPGNN